MVKKGDIPLTIEQQKELVDLCPINKYCVIDQEQLPSCIPSGLGDKCIGAIVAASGYLDGEIILVNLIRRDGDCIDYEPFMWGYLQGDPLEYGIIFHHANFQNRTIPLSQNTWNTIEASGIMNYTIKDMVLENIDISNMGGNGNFPNVDQMPSNQKSAFEKFGDAIKNEFADS